MSLLSKISMIQATPTESIEILANIFATARGPPLSYHTPNNKEKLESILTGLKARKEGRK
jgi:hypothetical protein